MSSSSASSLTLTKTFLPGVWIDPDVKKITGLGSNYSDLNLYSHSFMYRRKITKRNKIKALYQQYGCFALKRINNKTTVGYYTGTIYTKENYQKFGSWNKVDYAITTHDDKKRAYVIEPFEDHMLLQWINDGTINCTQNLCNVEFVECEINDMPLIKVVTIKDIKKHEQLFVNYGCKYWNGRDKQKESK